jgi:hypothetical protein
MADLKKIVEELYTHSAVGDFDAAEKLLTDDFKVEEASSLPFGGVYSGKGALRELFPAVMGALGVAGMERGEVMVGENSVSNKVTLSFANPETQPVEIMEVFIFKGDKVCEIRPYFYNSDVAVSACEAFKTSQA